MLFSRTATGRPAKSVSAAGCQPASLSAQNAQKLFADLCTFLDYPGALIVEFGQPGDEFFDAG